MKFSVHLPTAAEGLAHPIPFATPKDLVRLATVSEAAGYHGVWGNDHLTTQQYVRELWPEPPNYYEVLVTLSFVAAATKRIEIGTALLIPAMRSVPALAKQVATLDRFSGGRFRLGVGLGAYREEFEALHPGLSGVNRGLWLEEAVESLRLLFEERRATFEGRFVRFRDVESFPKPVQHPFPIYVGGHNLKTIERAARWAQGWLPGWQPPEEMGRRISLLRDLTEQAGRPRDAVEVAPQLSVTMGRTHEEAEAAYWRSDLVKHRQSLAYTGRDLSKQVEANLVGSPEEIREKVAAYAELGVQHCCALWFTTSTIDEMVEQIQWFADEVIRLTVRTATEAANEESTTA